MSWDRKFREAIPVPKGPPLVILRDAAAYITALPARARSEPAWQAACLGVSPAIAQLLQCLRDRCEGMSLMAPSSKRNVAATPLRRRPIQKDIVEGCIGGPDKRSYEKDERGYSYPTSKIWRAAVVRCAISPCAMALAMRRCASIAPIASLWLGATTLQLRVSIDGLAKRRQWLKMCLFFALE
jgi:hypothetical protein